MVDAVKGGAPAYVSVFAGRIADTGADPVPLMAEAVRRLAVAPNAEAHLGEPTRASQHFSSGCDRLPCHHRDQRHSPKAVANRQGSRRLFTRNGKDVLQRRKGSRICALTLSEAALSPPIGGPRAFSSGMSLRLSASSSSALPSYIWLAQKTRFRCFYCLAADRYARPRRSNRVDVLAQLTSPGAAVSFWRAMGCAAPMFWSNLRFRW